MSDFDAIPWEVRLGSACDDRNTTLRNGLLTTCTWVTGHQRKLENAGVWLVWQGLQGWALLVLVVASRLDADRALAGTYLGIDVAIKEVLPSNEYDVAKYFEREWRLMKCAVHCPANQVQCSQPIQRGPPSKRRPLPWSFARTGTRQSHLYYLRVYREWFVQLQSVSS